MVVKRQGVALNAKALFKAHFALENFTVDNVLLHLGDRFGVLGFAHGVAQRGNVQRACWLVVGVDQRLQKRVTAIIVIEVSDFPGHLVENQAVFVQPKAERIEVVAGF